MGENGAAAERQRAARRVGGIRALLVPDLWVDNPDAIDLQALVRRGIRCLLVDVDNTLTPWGEPVAEQAHRFVERARRAGLAVAILSNARRHRRAAAAAALGVPAAGRAFKPLPRFFVNAAKMMGCTPGEVAVVGDQLWTDILGGKLAGMYTILVDPLRDRDHPFTRIWRVGERAVLRWMGRRGLLPADRVQARLRRRRGD
ncbi:MAG: YqeG family HAD IIIA-type phosphatase [Bacillota bacterium]